MKRDKIWIRPHVRPRPICFNEIFRGLAEREGLDLRLTDAGREVAVRLASAREESLAELLGDWWGPDRPTDLVQLVKSLNDELCGSDREEPRGGGAGVRL